MNSIARMDLVRSHMTVRVLVVSCCLLIALIFGGGGSLNPAQEIIVQVSSIVLIVFILAEFRFRRPSGIEIFAFAFLIAILALPVLQLIPLPPELWRNFPLRHVQVEIADFLGVGNDFAPLSVVPDATRRAGLVLVVPISAFLAGVQANAFERKCFILVVILGSALSAMVAIAQAAAGPDSGLVYMYGGAHVRAGYLTGLFANYNHQANLMVVTCVLSLGMARSNSSHRKFGLAAIYFGFATLFAAATVATGSRTGSAILAAAMIICFTGPAWRLAKLRPTIALGAFIAILLLAFAVAQTGAAQRLAARYALPTDARSRFWPEVWYVLRESWPTGTGLGTFDPVYRSLESLTSLGSHYINHAHNDYMEFIIETGLLGVLLIGAFLILFVYCLFRLVLAKKNGSNGGVYYLIALAVPMIHSIIDYPLRILTIEMVFGLLCGFAIATVRDLRVPDRNLKPD